MEYSPGLTNSPLNFMVLDKIFVLEEILITSEFCNLIFNFSDPKGR